MELKIYSNPKTFLQATEEYLSAREAENNMPLGVIGNLARDPALKANFLGLVEKNGLPVLILVRSGGHLIISGEKEHLHQSTDIFARHVLETGEEVPGLVGPKGQVEIFREIWEERFSLQWQEIMEQKIFRLDNVEKEPVSPGKLRPAVEKDIEMVTDWIENFSQEADPGGEIPPAVAREKAEGGIKNGEIFLWEDGNPVSMAKRARPTRKGIAITMVYTPKECRKKGYGTSVVSALSRKLLGENFRFCTLFTDAKNPVSNKIYEEVGYRVVGSALVGKFSKQP